MENVPREPVTITLPRELIKWLDEQVQKRTYANRSHGIELAILTLKEKTERKANIT